jgi:hypothetical protein
MQISHLRRITSRGVSATTVGANAKQVTKAHQINRRLFVTIFDSRSATPATTAITETGIEVNAAKPILKGTNDASISIGWPPKLEATENPSYSAQN